MDDQSFTLWTARARKRGETRQQFHLDCGYECSEGSESRPWSRGS